MRERTTSSSLERHGADDPTNQISARRSMAGALNGKRSTIFLASLLLLPPLAARAQTEAPPPAAAPPAEAAPPPAAPPVVAPPPATPPPAAAPPPTAAEAMPATRPDALPPIDVGAWTLIGGRFQSGNDSSKVSDWSMDNVAVELHAGGKIHKMVGVTVNLFANMSPGTGPYAVAATDGATNTPAAMGSPLGLGGLAGIEDAIISFDFTEGFHLWAGRLLVPVDRANWPVPER